MSKIVKDFNKDRTGFIGGSEISAVMGLNRWQTPLSVWALKTKQIEDPFEMNEAVEMGVDLEEFVAKKFEERSGKKVRVDNREFVHPDYPFLKAHIDRRIVGGQLLECKTCSAYKANEWNDDDIPDEYRLQVNFYLGMLNMDSGWIAVLIGGQKFVYKELKFSKELYDKQVEVAVDFWNNYVLTETPPMAIANDKDTLVELFPESRPGELKTLRGDDPELEATFNELALNRLEGKNQIKEIDVEVDESENLIRQMIGDDEGIESGQYKATWKNQDRTNLDIVAMKNDGVYEKYAVKKSIRVLRVVEKKSKKL